MLRKIWRWCKDLQSVLKLCRASIIVLAITAIAVLFVPQGRDILLTLGEREIGRSAGTLAWFALAAGFWALTIWYCARTMLRFHWRVPSSGAGRSGHAAALRRHVPWVLGTTAFTVIAAAFAKAALESDGDTKSRLWIFAAGSLVAAVILGVAVALARRAAAFMARRTHTRLSRYEPLQKGATGKLIELLDVSPDSPDPAADRWESLHDLPTGAKVFLGALILLTTLLFAIFTVDSGFATIPQSAAILLLAGAAWVVAGSALVYFAQRYEVPMVTLLLCALLLFSRCNDNHAVRTFAGTVERPQMDVATHFANWLDARDIGRSDVAQRYPVVLVAAEGGGVRAAYWTAVVLATLQDQTVFSIGEPDFARHVYAISGVSGGSLGGTVYTALVKDALQGRSLSCGNEASIPAPPFAQCAHEILSQDFLSPTLAAMLYPDLVQRFLFFPIPSFDRGRALETSWERAWERQQALTPGRFGAGTDRTTFHDLWSHNGAQWSDLYNLPMLFLNSTWVESGRRVIISPLQITSDEFADAEDYFSISPRPLRLSSAVHNSARFTFVSPAGTIKKNGCVWGHLVDGGYFENSGATTALEVLRAMRRGAKERWQRLRPIVLMISNDPDRQASVKPRRWLTESTSPISALLNTRVARGRHAQQALAARAQADSCFLDMHLDGVQGVPLGWSLSETAMAAMQAQVAEKIGNLPECWRSLIATPASDR